MHSFCGDIAPMETADIEIIFFSSSRYAIIVIVISLPTKEKPFYGRVAQLGERLVRNEEVVGSIPITSTIFTLLRQGFLLPPSFLRVANGATLPT